MINGDSGMPRPAVGETWASDVSEYTVAAIFKDGNCGNIAHGHVPHVHYTDGVWDRLSRFDGVEFKRVGGPETSGGGVAVGQRRRWKDSEHGPFVVRQAQNGQAFYAEFPDGASANFSAKYFEDNSILLPSTPAPPGLGGPVTNVVVDASLQPKKRPRTLREVMDTRYPDRCQWFTYSTPGGVGKQCEMTHSGPRSPYCEDHVFEAMDARRVAAAPSKPLPPAQSHCLGAGRGVWNLRGGR